MRYSRPLTFDLFYNLLDAAEARVQKIAVTELKDNTFYALVEMKTLEGEVKIDARPSDAIALALRSKVPIFVAEQVHPEQTASRSHPAGKLRRGRRTQRSHT